MTQPSSAPAMNAALPEPVISFEDVHMVFMPHFKKPVHALRGFSLTIQQGAIVGLLGPNGCGKTTAISCLLGLLQHQAGTIKINGEAINGCPASGNSHTNGVLLEDTRLPPFLSVAAALKTVCRIRGFSGSSERGEMDRIIDIAKIEPLLSRRISILSKGQSRRVGLAAALIGDPALMILDEPSAGLDVSSRVEFNELLQNLRSGSRTIILASHLLSDIETTCSHVAIMQQGRIVLFERSETLLAPGTGQSLKDIYIDQRFTEVLDRLNISHAPGKYPGQVLISFHEPEHEVLLRLAQSRVVPSRIEPRENLTTLYLDITNGSIA